MAISTRTVTSLSPPWTQANLVTALQTAFTNAGFDAPFHSYTSGTDQLFVYRVILDNTKTYGSVFLRIRVTSTFQIYQQLYSGWTIGTSSGTDGSTEVSYITLSNSVTVTFNAFNGANEVKQVIVTQNSLFAPLGLIFPENRPTRWDLNSYPYGFIWTSINPATLRSTSRNMYGNSDFTTYLNDSSLSSASPGGDGNDLIRGIVLKSSANNGIGCQSSNNLGYGCVNGINRFTSIPITGTTQIWTVINNVSGGYVIQTQ